MWDSTRTAQRLQWGHPGLSRHWVLRTPSSLTGVNAPRAAHTHALAFREQEPCPSPTRHTSGLPPSTCMCTHEGSPGTSLDTRRKLGGGVRRSSLLLVVTGGPVHQKPDGPFLMQRTPSSLWRDLGPATQERAGWSGPTFPSAGSQGTCPHTPLMLGLPWPEPPRLSVPHSLGTSRCASQGQKTWLPWVAQV